MTADMPAGRAVRALAWTAAAAWLAAWFLPVMEDYRGWDAFRAALEAPFRHAFPTPPEDAVPQVFSALTNLAFPVMLAMLVRRRVVHHARFLKVAIICLVIDHYWLVLAVRSNEWKSLLAGYYVWLAAFYLLTLLAAINAASNRRTSRTPTAGTPP
jgi:hypothetical protein